MDYQYIVFQDSFSGFKWISELGADTLENVIKNITEGGNTRNFMYFIYKKHETNVPLLGTKFDTYKYCKVIAGSKVAPPHSYKTNCHEYALSHKSSMAWFFTDNMFE